jgi:DNA-binding CsgD family transcriptional regulator
VLNVFEALASERGRLSALTNAARVRGNLEAARGRVDEATTAFSDGLRYAEGVSYPFDRALLQLSYGSFVRRRGRRTEAVIQLQAARERFARLGARPYLERCDRELAACGVARGRSRDPDRSKLTPQELSVARLVATGMSNPKVAAELYVSINTVEFHLKNVYGKLGIRSRDQLAEKMATA